MGCIDPDSAIGRVAVMVAIWPTASEGMTYVAIKNWSTEGKAWGKFDLIIFFSRQIQLNQIGNEANAHQFPWSFDLASDQINHSRQYKLYLHWDLM